LNDDFFSEEPDRLSRRPSRRGAAVCPGWGWFCWGWFCWGWLGWDWLGPPSAAASVDPGDGVLPPEPVAGTPVGATGIAAARPEAEPTPGPEACSPAVEAGAGAAKYSYRGAGRGGFTPGRCVPMGIRRGCEVESPSAGVEEGSGVELIGLSGCGFENAGNRT